MVYWAHPSEHPERLSSFCRVHGRGRETDRPTDRPRYFVCSTRNRPLLASAAMRPKNWKVLTTKNKGVYSYYHRKRVSNEEIRRKLESTLHVMAGACIKNSRKKNSEARVEMVNRCLRRRPGRPRENWLGTVS